MLGDYYEDEMKLIHVETPAEKLMVAEIATLKEQVRELEAEKKRIRKSLEECLKLQNHYASLLNLYDGGSRLTFRSAQEWINRLQELGILAGKEAK